jgi:hypothetical protein
MKALPLACRGAGNSLLFLLLAIVSLHAAPAPDPTKSRILQNEADEQNVRAHTAAVTAQIQSLIDELAANGISGDDVKVLNATKAALSHLSTQEMDGVIASLKKAGEASDSSAGQQGVVQAYAGQQGIILQFRQILKEYEQRDAAFELPVRFKELSDRQTETMKTTEEVAATAAGKETKELSTVQQTTEQIVQADEQALANEVALAQQQVDKAVPGSTGDEGKALQQAQQDLNGGQLQQALNEASADLKAGKLLKALDAQMVARNELRKVTQDLSPADSPADALGEIDADLGKVITEQENLHDQTKAAYGVKVPVTGLDAKQGDLVDETNLVGQDLQNTNATAAAIVMVAIDPMQTSRSLLAQGANAFLKAADSQEQAIAKLKEAQAQLQQQVADAQKATQDAAGDPVAKLQALQQQIQTAMQQQQQVTSQTAQAADTSDSPTPPDPMAASQAQQQQSQLEQQTAAMQQAAEPFSTDTAQALADAAADMNQAQQNILDPMNASKVPAAQQAAEKALAQADQQVAQQIAQAQQAQQPPADANALAAAANSLQQAQDSTSSAIADVNPPSGDSPTPSASSMADAASALAQADKDAQSAAGTPGLPDAATSAVAEAKADIAQGEQSAGQGDAKATAAAAASAQSALAQAKAAVAMAQAGMAASGAPETADASHPDAPGPGQHPPGPDMASDEGGKNISGGSNEKGTLHGASGNGKFVTVASRDRAALDQTQEEKRPQEYAPMIDQYMKNLADQSSSP